MKRTAAVFLGLICVALPALCGAGVPTVVPEPDSVILLGTIAAGIGVYTWYRGRKKGR